MLEQRVNLLANFFAHEGRLYDALLVRKGCLALSRTRIEFEFEFIREQDSTSLCKGRCAIIWVNSQHRPAIMPDSLYDGTVEYYGFKES